MTGEAYTLQQRIIRFLESEGHQVELPYRDVAPRVWNYPDGVANIAATIGGKSVKIHVKGDYNQGPSQKDYQQKVENAGGIYTIVTGWEEFHNWYTNTF